VFVVGSKVKLVEEKARVCLDKKVEIPGAPLWHMGRAAKFGDQKSFQYVQDALDYLTCKARAKMPFEAQDKEFMKEVYEAFYWGGLYKGYKEAAQLANHYVNGGGKLLRINAEVYKNSKIVQATMAAMKAYVSELKVNKTTVTRLRSNNPAFVASKHALPLKKMNFRTEGKMKSGGVLEAAQNDHRLHKADGHFYLDAMMSFSDNGNVKTVWWIDSLYDFEPFEKQNYYTLIPLGGYKLTIYDGLSEYLTRVGVADVFDYRAEWNELWKL
jgi:hypothetical protein